MNGETIRLMPSRRFKPIPHPWIDSARAPMYVVRMPSPMPLTELISFCAAREQWATTQIGPVAFVVDISKLTTREATARHRELFAEHMRRFEPFERQHTCAVGIVSSGAVTRGIVSAVFWLQHPTFAYCVVPTAEEAIVFTQARLELALRRRPSIALA
ncbi:MAG: hypothetical protein ABW352_04200 [Polyangiales bacterium]